MTNDPSEESVPKKKSSRSNKPVAIDQVEKLPTADAPIKKSASKKKTFTKKAKEDAKYVDAATVEFVKGKKPSNKNSASRKKSGMSLETDFTKISKSALSRKKVKELREFLELKGVSTNGNDGKPLKKSGLIDEIMSL